MEKPRITKEQAEQLQKNIDTFNKLEKPKDCRHDICLCCNHALDEELEVFEKTSWYSRDIYKCPHCGTKIVECLGGCGRYYSEKESFNRLCIYCMGNGVKTFFYNISKAVAENSKKILDQQNGKR